MKIGFDLWGTLIQANPQFPKEKKICIKNSGTILECCKGHRKTYKQFKWKFYE